MNEVIFNKSMADIDLRLQAKGLAIPQRPLHALRELSIGYNGLLMGAGIDKSKYGPFEGPNLEDKINEWYRKYYADRMDFGTIDRVPLLIRGEVYFARIPIVFGSVELNPLEQIEDITPAMLNMIGMDSCRAACEDWGECFESIQHLESIYVNKEYLDQYNEYVKDLCHSARRDRWAASRCLSVTGLPDTNGCAFHSQQHAEKILKALIVAHNESHDKIKKKYRHKLIKMYNDVKSYYPDCCRIAPSDIHLLSNITMQVRYGTDVALSAAIQAYRASLRVGRIAISAISPSEDNYTVRIKE